MVWKIGRIPQWMQSILLCKCIHASFYKKLAVEELLSIRNEKKKKVLSRCSFVRILRTVGFLFAFIFYPPSAIRDFLWKSFLSPWIRTIKIYRQICNVQSQCSEGLWGKLLGTLVSLLRDINSFLFYLLT